MRVSKLMPGQVNRANEVRAAPGGKAAHVAMVLRTLGVDPLWLGFSGGITGTQLVSGLHALGIAVQTVNVAQETRVNLEVIDDSGGVTEILEPGLAIAEKDWESFFEVCDKLFSEAGPGTVIASGSLPSAAEPGCYARLTRLAHQRGHKMFLDCGGEPMRLALDAAPDFIKPNREEAEILVGEKIRDSHAAQHAVSKLIRLGAKSAVVSLGQDGFVWQPAAGQHAYHVHPSNVAVTSSVGCGDATVAAFAYAVTTGLSATYTLQVAAACGAANCLADLPGRLREADIKNLLPQVRIEKLA
jgi:1-phosphofructokinase family hexose kinase